MTNPSIKAGDLRHSITIFAQTIVDGKAGKIPTYTTPFAENVPAAIEPMSATDVLRSGQAISEVNIPITIRYLPGIQANMRIQFNNGTTNPIYIVQGIINVDERNRRLTLACKALGPNF